MQKQDALARIAQGVTKFQTEIYPAQREMFERLKRGQEPLAMFVTCADSRVNPNLVTQTDPGRNLHRTQPRQHGSAVRGIRRRCHRGRRIRHAGAEGARHRRLRTHRLRRDESAAESRSRCRACPACSNG